MDIGDESTTTTVGDRGPKSKSGDGSRRPNFSTSEREALLQAYQVHQKTIEQRSDLPDFKRKVEKAWSAVVNAVNAVSTTTRSIQECQRKMRNLKTDFKKGEVKRKNERRKTGGGTSEVSQTLTREEEMISQIVPPEMIDGILANNPEEEDRSSSDQESEQGDHLESGKDVADSDDEIGLQYHLHRDPLGGSPCIVPTAQGIAQRDQSIFETARQRPNRDSTRIFNRSESSPNLGEAAGSSSTISKPAAPPTVGAKSTLAKKTGSKRMRMVDDVAEYAREEHEIKMQVYREQLKAAKEEKEAAMIKREYWMKVSTEFYNGEPLALQNSD